MDVKLKKRLNDLYRLANDKSNSHESSLAQTILNQLMKKHGITRASEFTSDISDNDVSSEWFRFKVKIDPFSRSIAILVGSYGDDTIIFNGDCILCKKESSHTYITNIFKRYDYHINQFQFSNSTSQKSMFNRQGKADYSNGFRTGIMFYFEEKKKSDNVDNQIDNSDKLMPISQKLEKIISENAMPVSPAETNMGDIKNHQLFMIGLKHGKEWDKVYLSN